MACGALFRGEWLAMAQSIAKRPNRILESLRTPTEFVRACVAASGVRVGELAKFIQQLATAKAMRLVCKKKIITPTHEQ